MQCDRILLEIGDYFFLTFHTALSLFNTFGWIFKKTRPWHLTSILLTASSWFVLGIWYGWGYCPCTDWHWMIRDALGRPIESWSYIHFLIQELTGINAPPEIVDVSVLAVLIVSTVMSVVLNVRDRIKRMP